MQRILKKSVLVAGVVFAAAAMSPAQQLPLPGKTLSQPALNLEGADQPAKNVKSIFKGVSSPLCPYLGWPLRDLLVYARANHPSVYRQAVALRRTGFTQLQVRDWLESELCLAEGF